MAGRGGRVSRWHAPGTAQQAPVTGARDSGSAGSFRFAIEVFGPVRGQQSVLLALSVHNASVRPGGGFGSVRTFRFSLVGDCNQFGSVRFGSCWNCSAQAGSVRFCGLHASSPPQHALNRASSQGRRIIDALSLDSVTQRYVGRLSSARMALKLLANGLEARACSV